MFFGSAESKVAGEYRRVKSRQATSRIAAVHSGREARVINCFARAFDFGGQVTKGVWGMSWRQEALKGVEDCDKRGVAVKQAMIPRYPNWRTLNP